MFKNKFLKGLVLGATLVAFSPSSHAIVVETNENAMQLANTLLSGSNVTVTNAYFGTPLSCENNNENELFLCGEGEGEEGLSIIQTGTYINNEGTYSLPGPGIILSTGHVANYGSGNNTSTDTTGIAGTTATEEQNALLTPLTGIQDHYDPIELNIEFTVAEGVDSITFIGAFGSEEFPEYQFSNVTDGFGLFVNGVNVAAAGGFPINIDHPDMIALGGITTELDGMLSPDGIPLVRFDVPVTPGANTFKIILADAGDSLYDTTIYLSSFGDAGVNLGATEFSPLLPSNVPDPETGAFIFNLPDGFGDGQTIWIDPEIATGYVYEVTGGTTFASVTAPSLLTVNDADGYVISFDYGLGAGLEMVTLLAGQTYFFDADLLTSFLLNDIDPALMLDPSNPLAFTLGLSFDNVSAITTISMTPVTTSTGPTTTVAEPATLPLLGFGLIGFGLMLRKRKK